MANTAAAARVEIPAFSYTCARCVCTVDIEMCSAVPTSPIDMPRTMSRSTSTSRSVSPAGRDRYPPSRLPRRFEHALDGFGVERHPAHRVSGSVRAVSGPMRARLR